MADTTVDRMRPFMTTPNVDIEGMIKAFGIDLDMDAHLHPDIIGQIERKNGAYRISVQGTDHPNRKRFTAAHELGHYLFHRDLLGDGIDDSRMYRSENLGLFYNTNIKPRHETEANKFAATVLMPEKLVRAKHRELGGNLRTLAREFHVSPAAMRIRLNGLGLQGAE